MIYVLYHAHCTDGFGAAFAAWKKFGDNAKYIPVSYGKPLPNLDKAKMVYILDFSYDEETLRNLYKKVEVVVLDHHKTAEKDLKDLSFAKFDMNKSGAMMAWEYFHPEKDVPLMIRYIQDRDLWKFEMKLTKEFHLGLAAIPQIFEVWDKADENDLTQAGSAILSYQNTLVERILSSARVMMAGEFMDEFMVLPYKIAVVNSGVLESEVGNDLLAKFPDIDFALVYYTTKDGKTKYSLRSEDSRADVSEIAKLFGGGGHRNASGFIV
jgi:oligoribonuclease NrnB/cAMP/cGMP phosphodiesterase (DHH superfamily)